MGHRLLIGLVQVLFLTAGAVQAQGLGGYVVEDPYADLPRIQLAPTDAEPRPAPPPLVPQAHPPAIGIPPVRLPPLTGPGPTPITPREALGLAIQDRLMRELDSLAPGLGAPSEAWRGRRGWRALRRGRGWNNNDWDDDARGHDDWDRDDDWDDDLDN